MVRQFCCTRKGFGLIEVVVALTLVAVAALSIAATGAFSQRLLHRAEIIEEGQRMGEVVLDSLEMTHTIGSGVFENERIRIEWTHASTGSIADISSRDETIGVHFRLRAEMMPTLSDAPCPSC